jgi:ribosomal protein S27AE
VREQAPSTPAPEHVEDGVQYLARFVSSGTSARFGRGNEGLEDLPFVVAEVGRVGASGGYDTATPSRFGSRILRALTPSQTPSQLDFSHVRSPSSRSAEDEVEAPAHRSHLRDEARTELRNGTLRECPSPVCWGAPFRRRVRCSWSCGEEVVVAFEARRLLAGRCRWATRKQPHRHSWIP